MAAPSRQAQPGRSSTQRRGGALSSTSPNLKSPSSFSSPAQKNVSHLPAEPALELASATAASSAALAAFAPPGQVVVTGQCYFRTLDAGWACGCRHFWKRRGHAGVMERQDEEWCVCAHHACFHDGFGGGAVVVPRASFAGQHANTELANQQQQGVSLAEDVLGFPSAGVGAGIGFIEASVTAASNLQIAATTGQAATGSATHHHHHHHQQQFTQSEASTSYQPRLPRSCLRSDEIASSRDSQPADRVIGSTSLALEAAGLGLVMQRNLPRNTTAPQAPESNDAVALSSYLLSGGRHDSNNGRALVTAGRSQGSRDRSSSSEGLAAALKTVEALIGNVQSNPSDILSTRQGTSENVDESRVSPSNQPNAQVQPSHRLHAPLDCSNVSPSFGFEDLLQSATELATPSAGNTPNPNIPQGIPGLASGSFKPLLPSNQRAMAPPNTALRGPYTPQQQQSQQRIGSNSANTPMSNIDFPLPMLPGNEAGSSRETMFHFNALRNHLSLHRSQIKGMNDRLDSLESRSFSQPLLDQELYDRFESMETRLLDIEAKVDDHSKIFASYEVDSSDLEAPQLKRRRQLTQDHESSGSDRSANSAHSIASSALIATAEAGRNVKSRMDGLEDRIIGLERSLPPSLDRPLEVEVVLVPWGRQLRGLWVSPDDHLKSTSSKFTTQDTEEWTNSRSERSSSRMSLSLRANTANGWSSQAIHEWAENTDEWLIPKACGLKNIAYHRLKSRGFVKQVELVRPGAKETQDAIFNAFGDLLSTLERTDPSDHGNDGAGADSKESPFLALDAPFIPLRKLHASSRLHFLSKSEMLTPALWTAEFLQSSVVMRAPAGLRRLFITHRESYLQRSDESHPSWTWQKLRQLPRVSDDGGEVQEANAKESCWAEHPMLDSPPLSVHTSFGSHVSNREPTQDLQAEPESNDAEDHIDLKSEEPSSLDSREAAQVFSRPIHPITPLSEFSTQPGFPFFQPPNSRYNLRRHHRTLSVPLTDASYGSAAARASASQQPRSFSASSKRVRSFEVPSNPLIAQLPSFIPSPAKSRRPVKRRRISGRTTSSKGENSGVMTDLSSRLSTGSPYVAVFDESDALSQGRDGKRALTPLAYATPFSGTIGAGFTVEDAGEGDDGEVWEGVEDEDCEADSHVDAIEADKDGEVEGGYDDDDNEEDDGSSLFLEEGDGVE